MNKEVVVSDLGLIPYKTARSIQENVLGAIVKEKNGDYGGTPNHVFFCEHPHVYTSGRSGCEDNLLVDRQVLKKIGAEYHKTNRGGDITYHGPGQIVVYPVIDLDNIRISVKKYIFLLEETVIRTLTGYGLRGERLHGATGVWLDSVNADKARKICAIGVRISRWVTMHGFALNVNTGLDFFNYIHPCGLIGCNITSMEKELGRKQDTAKVKTILLKHFTDVFRVKVKHELTEVTYQNTEQLWKKDG
ncbi:MAG: lipoyl(octanoyl) transferase LipB [Bacteroidetes bacterium]|nr:lipoyl(octanoyl) transferase LipB [Bacteroidota bacterium]